MAEREHILADFQACTGIEDIEESIVILEQSEWILMDAVQVAMAGLDVPPRVDRPLMPSFEAPPSYASTTGAILTRTIFNDGISGTAYFPSHEPSRPEPQMPSSALIDLPMGASASVPIVAGGMGIASASLGQLDHPSAFVSTGGDAHPTRFISFKIEYRDRDISLNVPDSETVGKLKEFIEIEAGVPKDKQELCGWVSKNDKRISDEDILRDLRLPKENTLFLLTPDVTQPTVIRPNNGESPDILERLAQTFTLNIKFIDKDKLFRLNFPGSKTVQEVKSDVFALTDVPVRNQNWTGWPNGSGLDESMTLAGSGVNFPCHELAMSQTTPHPPAPPTRMTSSRDQVAEASDDEMDVDSSDDFEDAPESFNIDEFEDNFQSSRQEPLMPDDAHNETEALETFSKHFGERYGQCHPVFYIGSLDDAIRDSLQCRARERKLLAIYLHHDNSILANVFCSQILCDEGIVAYLANNFFVWGWDLTMDSNRAKLLSMCTKQFGTVAANTVKSFRPDELPLLLIISRNRATNEVVNVMRGNTNLDELMTQLIQAAEAFKDQQHQEIFEEDQREEREAMKRSQDNAYEESLATDRAKSEAKKREVEVIRKKEKEEKDKKIEEEAKQKQDEMEKEAIERSLADQLPDEPPANCLDPVSTLRIRCADGKLLTRRFLAQNPLQVLLNYITTQGYHVTEYKVLTTFPRRDLSQMDMHQTLQDLKLYPQETLILEEK